MRMRLSFGRSKWDLLKESREICSCPLIVIIILLVRLIGHVTWLRYLVCDLMSGSNVFIDAGIVTAN